MSRFRNQVEREIDSLMGSARSPDRARFSSDQLGGLPAPAQRYFKYALPDGSPMIRAATVELDGEFRMKPGSQPAPLSGVQYFTSHHPGFIWYASIRPNRLLKITARDRYVGGRGAMLVKLWSVFTIIDETGPEIDTAAQMRYLAEAVWFPTALLPSPTVRWIAIDARHARVALTHPDHDREVWLTVEVNDRGQIVSVRGKRERDGELTGWGGQLDAYQEFNGVMIPTVARVNWELDTGTYNYVTERVRRIDYEYATQHEKGA